MKTTCGSLLRVEHVSCTFNSVFDKYSIYVNYHCEKPPSILSKNNWLGYRDVGNICSNYRCGMFTSAGSCAPFYPLTKLGQVIRPAICTVHSLLFLFPQEFECGVQIESRESSKQEWSFTLYDFDGQGKITKEVSVCVSQSGLIWRAEYVSEVGPCSLLTVPQPPPFGLTCPYTYMNSLYISITVARTTSPKFLIYP